MELRSSDGLMALSLLATQTGVKTGILLNRKPRYQPGEDGGGGGVGGTVNGLTDGVAA